MARWNDPENALACAYAEKYTSYAVKHLSPEDFFF
jgi:hypothetical protein